MTSLLIDTSNSTETTELGRRIGRCLQGGEILELTSDLGGGKTTLAKGIVAGLGSTDLVSSPTFTISNVYECGKLTVHHYDFYRLGELGLMSEELQETLSDPEAISIIEWAGAAHELLPKEKLIHIAIDLVAKDENARRITVTTDNESLLERLREKKGAE